ncbi:MAG TPA: hypothetical protein VFS16_03935 [Acidimicrobiia bacterium]|nr:hypothetical protein [Acidimicrobiia bacterium]
MGRPQQPELARSAKTDLDPDHVETGLQGQKAPATGGETGPVPADNQPGHHPAKEQDKPDLDAFAAKLGADPKAPSATSARKPGRPKAAAPKSKTTESKSAPAKSTPAKSAPARSTPAKTAPAGSTATKPTPAAQPAAAPAWPESAPARDDLGPLAEPAQAPAQEPIMVSWALLPLRETVRQLERLERRLTERLTNR